MNGYVWARCAAQQVRDSAAEIGCSIAAAFSSMRDVLAEDLLVTCPDATLYAWEELEQMLGVARGLSPDVPMDVSSYICNPPASDLVGRARIDFSHEYITGSPRPGS